MQSIERSAAKFAAKLAVYKPIVALLVKKTHVGVAISNDYLTLAEPVTGAMFESFFVTPKRNNSVHTPAN